MVKLTAWLITVAIAAPLMPSEHPEINTGSNIIFKIPPVVRPIIANFAFPSLLNRLFITNEPAINGNPAIIQSE